MCRRRSTLPLPAARRLLAAVVVPLAALLCLLGTVAPAGASGSHAGAATRHRIPVPHRTRRLPAGIEGLAPYQPEKFCRHSVEPGVTRFEHLLTRTYRHTAIVSDLRSCEKGQVSEHFDGRALDWGVDHRKPAERADGRALLHWLFATDSAGHTDAMLRRLGIMYIIWNKRMWGAWDQRWQPYACHGATACHVDHMHFSFGWAGAEAKTSWFSGKVSPVVGYPPHHKHHTS
jgi:hypothetical protein